MKGWFTVTVIAISGNAETGPIIDSWEDVVNELTAKDAWNVAVQRYSKTDGWVTDIRVATPQEVIDYLTWKYLAPNNPNANDLPL